MPTTNAPTPTAANATAAATPPRPVRMTTTPQQQLFMSPAGMAALRLNGELNEHEPQYLDLADEETLLIYGWAWEMGESDLNTKFRFNEAGTRVSKVKLVSHFKKSVDGLTDGYIDCDEGKKWRNLIEMALKKKYSGNLPAANTEEWKTDGYVDLPFAVDKKFYKTAKDGKLEEINGPLIQGDDGQYWHTAFLRRKDANHKEDGKSAGAIGKAAAMLQAMQAVMQPCKYYSNRLKKYSFEFKCSGLPAT
jgi:hypothetical protein